MRLVAGVDRLIIGVVEEEVKPSVDKASERSATKAMREEEKAALRALKQEERAAARVHRDAAKAAARADREAGRTGPGGGGGGRRLGMLRMRRAASGPNIGVLVEQENADSITGGEASSPDRDPSLGSSPSLSVSPDVHRRVLQHGRSRSQHLPEVLPASDGEVEGGSFRRAKDAAGPAASSPLRISQPSPGGNGHPMRSPFTQGDSDFLLAILHNLFCSHRALINQQHQPQVNFALLQRGFFMVECSMRRRSGRSHNTSADTSRGAFSSALLWRRFGAEHLLC